MANKFAISVLLLLTLVYCIQAVFQEPDVAIDVSDLQRLLERVEQLEQNNAVQKKEIAVLKDTIKSLAEREDEITAEADDLKSSRKSVTSEMYTGNNVIFGYVLNRANACLKCCIDDVMYDSM